jgi:hypothetical protein
MYRGIRVETKAAGIVAEYNTRQRLAKLGFTSPLSELPAIKGEAFIIISNKISELEAKEQEKRQRQAKKRRK